ncbi:MAG: hypothetical protein JWP81_782 [Ferruginibacter sp.]|nr:hypothetical protein [Ferruginibacter sp.]
MSKLRTALVCIVVFIIFLSCKKEGNAVTTNPPVVTPPVQVDQVDTTTKIIPPAIYPGYVLLWNDEFNGSEIDVQKWNFETGTGVNGDFGTGQLDRATNRAENARIENSVLNSGGGCLAITTRRENFLDRGYTSARLTTSGKGSWGPGNRIEARIWARDTRYKGQGFAFWMMPAELPATETYLMWPQGGEIDIMEYVGAIPYHNLGSVHYAWGWENNQYQNWNHGQKGAYYSYGEKQVPVSNPAYGGWPATTTDPGAGSNGFHIYRIDWFINRMEFSIDEQVYHIHYFKDGDAFNNGAADGQDKDAVESINGKRIFKSEYSNHFKEWSPFEHKFFILLTAGVGGNDNQSYGGAIVPNAVFPCTTYIDWIRVYKQQ